MAGMPYAEANATMKIIGVVMLFIITVFTIPLANAVIDAVMDYHSPESIHIPGA
jgi:membrane protein insertase Oxa1/YidC/SpoIIIJ